MVCFLQLRVTLIPRMVLISHKSLILTCSRNLDLTAAISFLKLQNSPRLSIWEEMNVVLEFLWWINTQGSK